ncbi:hypothetical protein Ae717Ps2_7313 [Pseudonocardia sp. Ae717_Ps2]|nr:hypothetical protein Ae717Ps2_7313 [Pseudonocardia sp. Ae717_Ps2]
MCLNVGRPGGLPLVVPGTHVGRPRSTQTGQTRDQDIVEAGELRQRRIAPHALAERVAP